MKDYSVAELSGLHGHQLRIVEATLSVLIHSSSPAAHRAPACSRNFVLF
jgi:hypothetical protein